MEIQEDRYKKIFGKDFDKFKESIGKHQKFSIRVNTLKIDVDTFKEIMYHQGIEYTQVPWCEEGFFIENEEDIKNMSDLEEHKQGLFFIQNASSMIPPIALDPNENDNILDMCAAPGAKTTQMAAMMNNEGNIVAVEKTLGRMKALQSNIKRMGTENIQTFLGDVRTLLGEELKFSKVLLDAPCTGTGCLKPYLLKRSHKSVKTMKNMQKNLLKAATQLVRNGGTIVYSTCSLEPEENEAIVHYAITKLGLSVVDIDLNISKSETIKEWKGEVFHEDVSKSLRILPTSTETEGFFIAKFKKG